MPTSRSPPSMRSSPPCTAKTSVHRAQRARQYVAPVRGDQHGTARIRLRPLLRRAHLPQGGSRVRLRARFALLTSLASMWTGAARAEDGPLRARADLLEEYRL